MAVGEARVFIERPAREIIEFVLDLRSYQRVDAKLGRVYWVRRDGDTVLFRFQPRLLGLPGPPTTQQVELAEDERSIRVGGLPSWSDRLVRFAASFTFTPEDGGTWVERRVELHFAKPLAALLDRPITTWLANDVPTELANAKKALEKS